MNAKRIAIVGGCGHVGIPLGLACAEKGFRVTLVDSDERSVETIRSGRIPFLEVGAQEILERTYPDFLDATTDRRRVSEADIVFFVVGTPVDEHHNPRINTFLDIVGEYIPLLTPEKLIILRSTLYPGTTELVYKRFLSDWGRAKVAFCPERIVQGKGIEEIFKLPQIVSGSTEEARIEAGEFFEKIASKVIYLETVEAELAKLITNTWRYVEFAIANQFYMMVEQRGHDFYKIYDALKDDYPRANHYHQPGLTAGPCLFKDTMQLSAFHNNNFFLGQLAMLINEGLPNFLIDQLEKKLGSLVNKKVCIMGMTFKPDNDDTRESLAFKLKKLLLFKMAEVIECDPYLPGTTSVSESLELADGFIMGVPHREFRDIKISKPFVDCWGVWRESL